jgi:hypothetical protein
VGKKSNASIKAHLQPPNLPMNEFEPFLLTKCCAAVKKKGDKVEERRIKIRFPK